MFQEARIHTLTPPASSFHLFAWKGLFDECHQPAILMQAVMGRW
jgi:hypothetical protein